MTVNAIISGTQAKVGSYFFLSYAHSDPLVGYSEAKPDDLVTKFFDDLTKAVKRHAVQLSGTGPGFYDRDIPVGSNWKESIRQALSVAQTFVPLYSAAYMDRSWPGQEWECFRRRMASAGLADPLERFVPILWAPLPPRDQNQEGLRAALDLGRDVDEYTENGVRLLLKIDSYRPSYDHIINVAARKIVELAEASPLEPSAAQDPDEVASPFVPGPHGTVFVIETAAPTVSTVAAEHDSRGYGEHSSDWRPFLDQELSLAEYAKQVAKQLGFRPEIAEIGAARKASSPGTRGPGIIVIDPWLVATDSGRLALQAVVENLPAWVMPMIVLGPADDATTRKLADQVQELLNAAGALPTESARRTAMSVTSLEGFVASVRILVAAAERQFLRQPIGRQKNRQVPSTWSSFVLRPAAPRRAQASMPDRPDSGPDSLEGTPDV
jgi:FxsC-like protein